MFSEPVIASSAYRHGLTTEDILHAFFNPIRVFDLDDGMQMFIGPNRAALLVEVGVLGGAEVPVIAHAMVARAKFLR